MTQVERAHIVSGAAGNLATVLGHIYAVTSPPLTGRGVVQRQQLLKTNWTHRDFLQGSVDGVFGPETGRACIRAKYWLGYAEASCTPVFGDTLWGYLTKTKPLPAANKKLILQRIAAAKAMPLRVKAFENALRDVGMTEHPPNSNECAISNRWGMRGPWCNMSVSEWYIDAGSTAFKLGVDWAYVPAMLAAAEHGQNGLALLRPEFVAQGDPVCFDWDSDGIPDHIGIFDRWIDKQTGRFATVEGNTAMGNNSNGGTVMRRDDRYMSEVAKYMRAPAFIRVGR